MSSIETTFIYALCEPTSGEARYVGKSDDPPARLQGHLSSSQLSAKTYKANWLRSLKKKGLKPAVQILEEVPKDEWQDAEHWWIAHYREQGARLTNSTSGGEGVPNLCEASRQRISEKRRELNARKRKAKGIEVASDYFQVVWDAEKQRWIASIQFPDEPVFLGYFYSPEDAAMAYETLAVTTYCVPRHFFPARQRNSSVR